MRLLKKLSVFLFLIMIFNMFLGSLSAYAVDVPEIDMRVELDEEFAYVLGFGGRVASFDVEIEYDKNYLDFVGTNSASIAVNEYEKGKVVMAYYDATGKNGLDGFRIIFKAKKTTGNSVTKLEIKDINIYSLLDDQEYTIDDLNERNRYKNVQIYKVIPEDLSTASTSLTTVATNTTNNDNNNNNNQNTTPIIVIPASNENNNNNEQYLEAQQEYIQFLENIVQEMIRDREERQNQQPQIIINTNTNTVTNTATNTTTNTVASVANTVNNTTNITTRRGSTNEVILIAKSAGNLSNTNTVAELVGAANTNPLTEAIEDIPKTGKQVSILFMAILVLSIIHFTKVGIKYRGFKKFAPVVCCLVVFICLEAVVSNAGINMTIRQYIKFGDMNRVILVIPNDEIRYISYKDFIKEKPSIVDVKEVYGADNLERLADELVASKDVAINEAGEEYKFIVYGDLNSDGKVNALDLGRYIKEYVEDRGLSRLERKVINVHNPDDSDDNVIDQGDLNRVRDFIIRKVEGNILEYLPEEVIEDFTIRASKTVVNKGEELQLDVITYPENSTIGEFYWESSDKNVLTVDEHGVIKGISPGYAEIRAYLNNNRVKYSKLDFSVESRVTGLYVEQDNLEIKVGREEALDIFVTPQDATIEMYFYHQVIMI